MSSGTLLQTVATHERDLMGKVQDAEQANRKAIEDAQADSISALQQLQSKLDVELSEKRQQAARAREKETDAIKNKTDQHLQKIRNAAAGKINAIRDEIVALLLPGKH